MLLAFIIFKKKLEILAPGENFWLPSNHLHVPLLVL